jgi:hypothetical protein
LWDRVFLFCRENKGFCRENKGFAGKTTKPNPTRTNPGVKSNIRTSKIWVLEGFVVSLVRRLSTSGKPSDTTVFPSGNKPFQNPNFLEYEITILRVLV